jgi:class 3 adenylate cyclase
MAVSESRKLAAILAADVVGYSRLAGADEERTLARLRALRSDLVDPTIALHHGRVVKRTGDGVLVEFRSVVDAVRCAIEVQTGMAERNTGLPPERRIEFRIGIHLGDVVEESDGDLMGDGINIAARLENIAEPNGLSISSAAYEQVRDRLREPFVDLGEVELKNMARPVRVYGLDLKRQATLLKEPTNPPQSGGGDDHAAPDQEPAHSALARLLIRQGLLFADQRLERAFADSFRDRCYFLGQTSMMFGIVAWLVFGATDLLSGTGGLSSTQFRFMLAMPVMLIFFAASFTQRARALWQRFFALFAVVGITCMYISLLLVGPESWFRFEQATMSFMLFMALIGLAPFTTVYTLGIGAVILALHVVYVLFYAQLDAIHAVFYSLFVASSYVIACVGAWVRESGLRSTFAACAPRQSH